MGLVDDIKAQVEKLPDEQRAELLTWLIEIDQKRWDAQLEADLAAGKLHDLISEAKADRAAGLARKL